MSLYPESLRGMLDAIKTANGVDLVASEYNFSDPTVVTRPNGNNAQIQITAKDVQSTYSGTVPVTVKRLDLADLGKLVPLNLRLHKPTKMSDVIKGMNDAWGLSLTLADVLEADLTTLTDGEGQVTVAAVATSIGWTGQVTLNISKGNYPLTQYLTHTQLNGIDYPAQITTRPYAKMYSYWRDFSVRQADLETVTVGADQLELLKSVLIQVTGDAWISAQAGRWSLFNATVAYAGATTGDSRFNQKYDKAIVVKLDQNSALGLAGDLIIHYNLPDPI